ncbi:MAG: hypothetical protein WC794_02865 [Candidatus Doudnabacteria bacterium]|jgi:hypothetical protein
MQLFFHEAIKATVEAAKKLAGVSASDVKMTFAQLVAFLTSKGVEFVVRPTTAKKTVEVKKGWWMFATVERVEVDMPAGEDIQIKGVGIIPPFEDLVSYYGDQIVEGRLEVSPGSVYFHQRVDWGITTVDVPKSVCEFVRALLPVYRPELPEDLVVLPTPGWVTEIRTDLATDVGPGMVELVLFRSQAEQMVRRFAISMAANLNSYVVVDLFREEVVATATTEEEATGHAIGMAGTVVVERAQKRVFDGEYQVWLPIKDYVGKFPAVSWLASI